MRESSTSTARDYVEPDHHAVSLAFDRRNALGRRAEARIVLVDDHAVEVPPAEHMLVVRNDDRPGMIGVVGTVLGEANVSISSMDVDPSRTEGTALMVLSTDKAIPDDAFDRLRGTEGILDIHRITCV